MNTLFDERCKLVVFHVDTVRLRNGLCKGVAVQPIRRFPQRSEDRPRQVSSVEQRFRLDIKAVRIAEDPQGLAYHGEIFTANLDLIFQLRDPHVDFMRLRFQSGYDVWLSHALKCKAISEILLLAFAP